MGICPRGPKRIALHAPQLHDRQPPLTRAPVAPAVPREHALAVVHRRRDGGRVRAGVLDGEPRRRSPALPREASETRPDHGGPLRCRRGPPTALHGTDVDPALVPVHPDRCPRGASLRGARGAPPRGRRPGPRGAPRRAHRLRPRPDRARRGWGAAARPIVADAPGDAGRAPRAPRTWRHGDVPREGRRPARPQVLRGARVGAAPSEGGPSVPEAPRAPTLLHCDDAGERRGPPAGTRSDGPQHGRDHRGPLRRPRRSGPPGASRRGTRPGARPLPQTPPGTTRRRKRRPTP